MVFAFMKRPPIFGEELCPCGVYNGYVGWTPDEGELPASWQGLHGHVEEGSALLDNMVDVHGGITFDVPCAEKDFNEKFPAEVSLTEMPESFEGCRIIGFDVCHCDDGPHHDELWCRNETMFLYRQIKEILNK